MRLTSSALLFVALATAPAFCQNAHTTNLVSAPTTATTALPSDATNASVDYVALKDDVTRQNKNLTDQLAQQRTIYKRNTDLLKEAQKVNAANLKLTDEQKKLAAASAELEKQRAALKAAQKPVEVASTVASN